jgi:hypothetical protein
METGYSLGNMFFERKQTFHTKVSKLFFMCLLHDKGGGVFPQI